MRDSWAVTLPSYTGRRKFYCPGVERGLLSLQGVLPWWLSGKESACNAGDVRRRFYPLIGKIPWRRARQPTPVFLPGEESHGQRSLAGYSPWGRKESDMTEVAEQQ